MWLTIIVIAILAYCAFTEWLDYKTAKAAAKNDSDC